MKYDSAIKSQFMFLGFESDFLPKTPTAWKKKTQQIITYSGYWNLYMKCNEFNNFKPVTD